MAASNPPDALLTRAIDKADEGVLRDILKSMCNASEACTEQASKLMLVPESEADLGQEKNKDEEEKPAEQPAAKKQKREQSEEKLVVRYQKCEDCDKMFDVTKNADGVCRTHEGELQLDADYFPDDDDIQYLGVEIDPKTDWRRDEFPEGFYWDCCDVKANGPTCLNGKHVALPSA